VQPRTVSGNKHGLKKRKGLVEILQNKISARPCVPGWSKFCKAKFLLAHASRAGRNFAKQNFCSPMHPGLVEILRNKISARPCILDCGGKSGFFANGLRRITFAKKGALSFVFGSAIVIIKNGL
jgi:hypothetical protein